MALFEASVKIDINNPMLTLGYVKSDGEVVVFSGDLTKKTIELKEKDALIVFSEH